MSMFVRLIATPAYTAMCISFCDLWDGVGTRDVHLLFVVLQFAPLPDNSIGERGKHATE